MPGVALAGLASSRAPGQGEAGFTMPVVKLTLTDEEMDLLRKWSNGSAIATIVKHTVLLKASIELGTLAVPTRYPPGTHCGPNEPSTHQVPTKGTSSTQRGPGTQIALQSTKKEEYIASETVDAAKRIIGHFNQTCGGTVGIMDQKVIAKIAQRLDAYSEDDAKAVITWAQERWPPGDEYRYCVALSYLLGDKFGEHLTASKQSKPKPKVFHPGAEFMIDYEEPGAND